MKTGLFKIDLSNPNDGIATDLLHWTFADWADGKFFSRKDEKCALLAEGEHYLGAVGIIHQIPPYNFCGDISSPYFSVSDVDHKIPLKANQSEWVDWFRGVFKIGKHERQLTLLLRSSIDYYGHDQKVVRYVLRHSFPYKAMEQIDDFYFETFSKKRKQKTLYISYFVIETTHRRLYYSTNYIGSSVKDAYLSFIDKGEYEKEYAQDNEIKHFFKEGKALNSFLPTFLAAYDRDLHLLNFDSSNDDVV